MNAGTRVAAPAFTDNRALRLYERAVRDQWDVSGVLDWKTLSLDRIARPVRGAMAELYADVLFAESFGIDVASRIVELSPEGGVRDFARTQVVDEARHAAFFTLVCEALGESERIATPLVALRDELRDVHDYDELLVHSQVVELAAHLLFVTNSRKTLRAMARGVKLPGTRPVATLLGCMVDHVGRDESRHIAFGAHCLSARLGSATVERRRYLEARAALSARLMVSAFAERRSIFSRLNVDPVALLDDVWNVIRRQLLRLNLEIGAPADA